MPADIADRGGIRPFAGEFSRPIKEKVPFNHKSRMSLNAHDLTVGVFVRGLTNLKAQLIKAEGHAAANGISETALLSAPLATDASTRRVMSPGPADLHTYPLAAHVHWTTEGAMLAVARLRGAPRVPAVSEATTFRDLHRRLDSTIDYLRQIARSELEAGLDREMVVDHRRGSVRSNGTRFLMGYAIPHFFYHVTAAYGILRNQGVPLTMGDFLGSWAS